MRKLAPSTALTLPAPVPAWAETAEAAHLIASCVASPPRRGFGPGTFNHATPHFDPSDPRIGKLKRIYRAAMPPIDTDEWDAWLRLDPEKAIRAAIGEQSRAAA